LGRVHPQQSPGGAGSPARSPSSAGARAANLAGAAEQTLITSLTTGINALVSASVRGFLSRGCSEELFS